MNVAGPIEICDELGLGIKAYMEIK